MAGFYGADVEQLRALAARLEQGAQGLDDAARSLGQQVMTATAWQGRDADGFRSEWGGSHRSRITAAAGGLRQAAQAVRRNADEQDGASRAGGGAAGGTVPRASRLPFLDPGELARPAVEPPIPGIRPIFGGGEDLFLPDGGSWGPDDGAYGDRLYELISGGVGIVGDAADIREILGHWNDRSLSSLSQYLTEVKGLSPGAVLSAVGIGFDAVDLGRALHSGDQGASMAEALDLAAGVAGIWIPGAGAAWDLGTLIGTGIWHGVDSAVGLDENGFDAGVEALLGPGVSSSDLTMEQAQAMVDRYKGAAGVWYALRDTVAGQM